LGGGKRASERRPSQAKNLSCSSCRLSCVRRRLSAFRHAGWNWAWQSGGSFSPHPLQ
jgi:hypothetical protein